MYEKYLAALGMVFMGSGLPLENFHILEGLK